LSEKLSSEFVCVFLVWHSVSKFYFDPVKGKYLKKTNTRTNAHANAHANAHTPHRKRKNWGQHCQEVAHWMSMAGYFTIFRGWVSKLSTKCFHQNNVSHTRFEIEVPPSHTSGHGHPRLLEGATNRY